MHQLARSVSNVLLHIGLETRYFDSKLLITMPDKTEIVVEIELAPKNKGRQPKVPVVKWAVVRCPGSGFSSITVFQTKDPAGHPAAVVKNILAMVTRLAVRSAVTTEAPEDSSLAPVQ